MRDRLRSELKWTLLVAWLPAAAVLLLAIALSDMTGASMRTLMQDATTVLDAPFYVGSVSLLGIVVWAMTTAVCLLVPFGIVPWLDASWRRFLLAAGAFSAILLVDDAILIHDEILPVYAGISGELYGAAYAVAIVAFVIGFRATILRTNYGLLVVALGLFGISAATDLLSDQMSALVTSRWAIFVEDGSKFTGIVTWLAYYVSVARQAAADGPIRGRAA